MPSPKRYSAYADYFRTLFGGRVQKVAVDAGFTCPNRDGSAGTGGCTYCSNESFNPSYCSAGKPVGLQIREGIAFHRKRYRRVKQYLAYFQAFSNTYAPLEKLKTLYEEALAVPGVIGLVIGTRPDCVDDEKLEYLGRLAKDQYVIVEYGIESRYDRTLQRINRGHTFGEAVQAIERTHEYGIRTGAHLIFGLPGESPADMLAGADSINALPLDTLKLHQLQLIKGTAMAREFSDHPQDFHRFTLDSYIEFVIDFIERLRPELVLERLFGEVPPRFLAEAPWGTLRNDQVLRLIEQRMEERDTRQGAVFSGLCH